MKNNINISFFRINILFFLLLFSSNLFSQEDQKVEKKGILLERKESSRKEFLPENKRIKLETIDGNILVGKFTIVNDSTISIRGNEVNLNSIERIKRRSVVSAIGSPIITAYGFGGIGLGVYAIAQGGIISVIDGTFLIPAGVGMVLLSTISQNHKPSKWNYSIVVKPEPKWQ
jgi:hypothetical protein